MTLKETIDMIRVRIADERRRATETKKQQKEQEEAGLKHRTEAVAQATIADLPALLERAQKGNVHDVQLCSSALTTLFPRLQTRIVELLKELGYRHNSDYLVRGPTVAFLVIPAEVLDPEPVTDEEETYAEDEPEEPLRRPAFPNSRRNER